MYQKWSPRPPSFHTINIIQLHESHPEFLQESEASEHSAEASAEALICQGEGEGEKAGCLFPMVGWSLEVKDGS